MYPIILLPSEISLALNRTISMPNEPFKPVLPVVPPVPNSFNDGVIVLGAGVLLLIAGHNFPELGLIVILFGIIWLVIKQQFINFYQGQYKKAKYEHYIISGKLNSYPKEYQKYKADLLAYEDTRLAEKLKKEEIRIILQGASLPSFSNKIEIFSRPQKGASESGFYPHLRAWFGENYIHENSFLSIHYSSNKKYYPDFAFIDFDSKLFIDIEIDEPYSFFDKKPIHCKGVVGINSRKADDAERNKYFLENIWIVIRFSEKQVIQYPEECCKVIAKTIWRWSK